MPAWLTTTVSWMIPRTNFWSQDLLSSWKKIKIDSIRVGSTEIQEVSSVCNLGARFDTSMTMTTHFGKACSKGFSGLYKIGQIRKFLSEKATATLIHTFVTSHLDYCNSLLYGVPKCQIDQLQKVSNAAARVTQQVPRYNHLTPVLRSLHWLPIAFRIKFKITLLVFKALKGMAPLYLSKMLLRKESEEDKVKLWDMCSASGANKQSFYWKTDFVVKNKNTI